MLSIAAHTKANVDEEWASSLAGLRTKVPVSWWIHNGSSGSSGNSGNHLHPGRIHSIDFEQDQRYFQSVQLDNIVAPELYPMRYDAVLDYADEDSECVI